MSSVSTESVQEHLLAEILESMRGEDAIHHLFNFIASHLPVHQILGYTMERAKKKMDVFLDYSSSSFSNEHYSAEILQMIPWERMQCMEMDVRHRIVVTGDIQKDPLIWEHSKHYPYYHRSRISIILHRDQENDRLLAVALFNPEPDAFTEADVEFLLPLYGWLQKLTADFFVQGKNAPCLSISFDSPMASSAEARLRMCPGMSELVRQIEIISPTGCTVLIQGATGVGKELVAQTLHESSPRRRQAFIKVNCASIPESLLDSAFFGFEKGSFTGAVTTRQGYFEQANKGTIFLDEVGELSLDAQSSLLRVLETHEIQRVGSARIIPLDIRVITATNRDLRNMVQQGTFREDLWYRLNVYSIQVPPLAERRQDIPILAKYYYQHYIREYGIQKAPVLTAQILQRIQRMSWPGNIRQLRYAIERGLLYSLGQNVQELILNQDVPQVKSTRKRVRENPSIQMAEQIRQALKSTGGKIQGRGGAAQMLGIPPATLRSRMHALGIPLPQDKS